MPHSSGCQIMDILPFRYYHLIHPEWEWWADGVRLWLTIVQWLLCDSWSHSEFSRDSTATVGKARRPSSERHQREGRTVAAACCLSDSTDLGVKNVAASIFISTTAALEILLITETVFTPTPTKQSAKVFSFICIFGRVDSQITCDFNQKSMHSLWPTPNHTTVFYKHRYSFLKAFCHWHYGLYFQIWKPMKNHFAPMMRFQRYT